MMTVYIGLCFKKLLYLEDDSISLFLEKLDLSELGVVDYTDTDSLFFLEVRKSKGGLRPLKLDEETESYVTFSMVHKDTNWYLPADIRHNYTASILRPCTQEDFCFHQECSESLIEYFEVWNGFTLLCPDYAHFKDGHGESALYGDTSMMI